MTPPLKITLHPEAPMTLGWSLWLSYVGGIGEIVASGTTARMWLERQPVRYDLICDNVGDCDEEAA